VKEGVFMVITDIREANAGRSERKKAYRIFIDDKFAFLLYEDEMEQFNLSVGTEISPDVYETIEDFVLKRARHKALNIIKYSDKTEKEICLRLKEEYYTDDIIEKAIEYLKIYNYLNDERYAENYVRSRKNKESRFSIESKLQSKGINKGVLEKIIAGEYEINDEDSDPEILAINKIIQKKCDNPTNLSYTDKMKLINMLKRKGFNSDKINKCL